MSNLYTALTFAAGFGIGAGVIGVALTYIVGSAAKGNTAGYKADREEVRKANDDNLAEMKRRNDLSERQIEVLTEIKYAIKFGDKAP